jgi:hypothetical protein
MEDVAPAAPRQDELEHQVHEVHAGDPHAELAAVGEVECPEAAGLMLLRKEHLLPGSVHRAPASDLPLQRAHLPGLEVLGVPPTQLVHQRRRQQLAVLVAPQVGLDLGGPHRRERVRPGPPAPARGRRGRHRAVLPGARRALAHASGRSGGLQCLSLHPFAPQNADLAVGDHRAAPPLARRGGKFSAVTIAVRSSTNRQI